MYKRKRLYLRYTGVFLAGLIIGAFMLETLEMHVRPSYRDIIVRSHLRTEQELLASQAARTKKPLDEAFHRWVVVNAQSEDGFRVLRVNNNELGGNYLYPFEMLGLKSMASSADYEKGKKITEGIDRGKLAVSLEKLGMKKEAEDQWKKAQQLTHNMTMKATKDFMYTLLEQEKSDLNPEVDEKALGPSNQ